MPYLPLPGSTGNCIEQVYIAATRATNVLASIAQRHSRPRR